MRLLLTMLAGLYIAMSVAPVQAHEVHRSPPIDPVTVPFVCYSCPPSLKGYCCPLPPAADGSAQGVPAFTSIDPISGEKQYYCDRSKYNAQCGGPCPTFKCPWALSARMNGPYLTMDIVPTIDRALCWRTPEDAMDFRVELEKNGITTDRTGLGAFPCQQTPYGEGYTVRFAEGGWIGVVPAASGVGFKLWDGDKAHALARWINQVTPIRWTGWSVILNDEVCRIERNQK